ncbi:MAG TPA: hypothetical protein VMV22_14995 [Acidimicrobiales bacterium]|nr:hypothetical protein [Acidimicrobiales bacterium]
MRRPLWLAAGAALGAGGTLWTRRRLERLSKRVRPGAVAGDLAAAVDRTTKGAADRVRSALDAGRDGARRREDDLWRDIAARERPAPGATRNHLPH